MRLAAARVAAFLRDPGACRVVLLLGDDVGLIRERAEALTRAVIGGGDDPFRLTELARDRIADLANEAAGLSLTGGRRVVRVRDVTDTDTIRAAVAALLDSPAPALVVLEAPGLASRAKLRTAVEAAPDGVAIACYPEEGSALDATIAAALAEAGLRAEPEAIGWLAAHLGADRAATRQELAKLALYVGPGGRVDLAAAMESVGDLAGLSLDDALFAATEGAVGQADRALELALAEGGTPVGVLRGGLMHLQRLHRARIAVDAGQSPAEAAKSVRPPVFFRRVDAFARALVLWPEPALRAAMGALGDAERACKRTGAPDFAICRHTIQTLARQAAARSGPGRRRPV
ncbi:MAG: DNA polymerase III subunit delta [Rhodospirillales bacterium]|nr:DNA polymerase III subunit delta [Rhodospirillales bacterium]